MQRRGGLKGHQVYRSAHAMIGWRKWGGAAQILHQKSLCKRGQLTCCQRRKHRRICFLRVKTTNRARGPRAVG